MNQYPKCVWMEDEDPMKKYLDEYITRLRPHYRAIPEKTAHEIASAFLTFRFGVYTNTLRECGIVIPLLGSGAANDALKKALMVINANAESMSNSRVHPDLSIRFSDDEPSYLAISLPPEKIEDPGTYQLDNALILVYAVAVITSPDDEEALDEHRKYVINILNAYKRALGIQ